MRWYVFHSISFYLAGSHHLDYICSGLSDSCSGATSSTRHRRQQKTKQNKIDNKMKEKKEKYRGGGNEQNKKI
jgi:hypothetical protein